MLSLNCHYLSPTSKKGIIKQKKVLFLSLMDKIYKVPTLTDVCYKYEWSNFGIYRQIYRYILNLRSIFDLKKR